ncbi:MAG: serine/threonine protein kinase, partial [Ktedonobacteraceae bacterium]
AVYQADDERFQATRVVAIKEMSDANLSTIEREKALVDFRREANLLVQLNHPNLPQVSDFFEEGTKAYLVMEFIEGKTLEQTLDDVGRPLDETLVMDWALQLCSVLQYLHSRKPPIIFRDMKPSNVMITVDNQLKLIDFGIARIFKTSAIKDTTLLGSQGYAPLEQYGRGQSDPRSDIYALGATLYHLLTGSVPADAPSRRVNPQVFLTPRQINQRISQATEDIVLMAMEQDPDERFQSAEAMRKAILEEREAQTSFAPYTKGLAARASLPPSTPSKMGDSQTMSNGTSSSTKSTFERTILPIAIDIGSTIYQAIKENSSRRADGNATSTEYAPQSTIVNQMQTMAPLSVAPRESVMRKGLHLVDNTLMIIFTGTYHLLGIASALLFLLLAARFVLTFFQLSLGTFSSWVIAISSPIVAPFGNMLVAVHPSATGNYMVDVSAIVALVVFSIVLALIRGLLKHFTKRRQGRTTIWI